MNDKKGYLAFLVGEEEGKRITKEFELKPPMGYNATDIPGALRVWDSTSTWVVSVNQLCGLQIPNRR